MFEYLVFYEYQSHLWSREIRIETDGGQIRYRTKSMEAGFPIGRQQEGVYPGDSAVFISSLENCHVDQWVKDLPNHNPTDSGWSLRYKEVGKPCIKLKGTDQELKGFSMFLKLIRSVSG